MEIFVRNRRSNSSGSECLAGSHQILLQALVSRDSDRPVLLFFLAVKYFFLPESSATKLLSWIILKCSTVLESLLNLGESKIVVWYVFYVDLCIPTF